MKANSVYSDEVIHYEPPHSDLGCLQIQLFILAVLALLLGQFQT